MAATKQDRMRDAATLVLVRHAAAPPPVLLGQRGDSGDRLKSTTRPGSVPFTFPTPRYRARKGTVWDVVRHELGPTFDTYFVTNVRYDTRKDIDAVIKTRKASDEVPDVLKAIERTEPTPRVGFKPT